MKINKIIFGLWIFFISGNILAEIVTGAKIDYSTIPSDKIHVLHYQDGFYVNSPNRFVCKIENMQDKVIYIKSDNVEDHSSCVPFQPHEIRSAVSVVTANNGTDKVPSQFQGIVNCGCTYGSSGSNCTPISGSDHGNDISVICQ